MKKSIKKKIIIGLCIIFGIMIIAALGASYYFGKLVTDGLFFLNEGNDTKENSIAQLELWGYDLEAFNNTYTGDEFSVEASDGNTIPVTYFSTDDNTDKDTVILSHGNGGDHVSVYPLAEMYLRNGWNVITYDMRGHGDNESQLMTFGYLERIDMEALVDYTEEITIDKQIVVHGQSMGGAGAGMYAATDHAAEHVDAVIMDSPVYSMEAMFALAWEEEDDSEGIPLSYMVACGNLYMKLNYGFTFKDVEITEEQKYNNVKSLVIVSTQDEVCFPENVIELYENIASSEKELVEIDAAHIMGIIDHADEYEVAVLGFLAK
ncbi:MAG: alpha/beta hydrolase [Lachnospiraceae bacterium]